MSELAPYEYRARCAALTKHGEQCSREGSEYVNGEHYCKQHSPRKKAKRMSNDLKERLFDLDHDAELYRLETQLAMCRLGGAITENVCRQYAGAANVQSALAAILEQATTLDEVESQLAKLTEENERLRELLQSVQTTLEDKRWNDIVAVAYAHGFAYDGPRVDMNAIKQTLAKEK